MAATGKLRSVVRQGRKRGTLWVRLIDLARLIGTGAGRGELWIRMLHGHDIHQTTPQTGPDRYPELFDLAACLMPDAKRILSFGCSTGEELVALRQRFPKAEIVGAEINPRSRRRARRLVAGDRRIHLVDRLSVSGNYDVVFALAVLQRQPHLVMTRNLDDLSHHYPFGRFDQALAELVAKLKSGGLLCLFHAHYPAEHSSVAAQLRAIEEAPMMEEPLFGRDGRRLVAPAARSMFVKRSAASP